MARLENYPEAVRNHLLKLPCPTFDSTPFNRPIPMKEQRVALVSTAGLHLRGDRPFGLGDADHRLIPWDTHANRLVMSHISTNFDRIGYLQDLNVVFSWNGSTTWPETAKSEARQNITPPSWRYGTGENGIHSGRTGFGHEERRGEHGAAGACLTELHARPGRAWTLF